MIQAIRPTLLGAIVGAVIVTIAILALSARAAPADAGPAVDPVVLADHAAPLALAAPAPPPPTPAADDPTILGDVWALWRVGGLALPLLLLLYFGGRAALDQRRWVARRWPRAARWLDRGKVWATLAGTITVAGTLLPLAIAGHLTGAATAAALSSAVALAISSTRRSQSDDPGANAEVPT